MSQEIHFVTGKGGVGKSVLALTLAYKKASQGRRVLLVELGDRSFYKDFLQRPEIGFQPTSLKPNLDLSLWSGADCLREYVLYLLKIEALYRLFFENPISRSLTNIAPALPEIAILGKITSGPRKHGPAMPYDCLVVDAYATGHFMSLVRAPGGMAQAIKFGPMAQQNKEIDRILRDSEICHYHIVALPEELPVKEAEELYFDMKDYLEVSPDFIINKILETDLESKQLKKISQRNSEMAQFSIYMEAVLDRQEDSLARLKKLRTKVQALPLVTESSPWGMIETLADRMQL